VVRVDVDPFGDLSSGRLADGMTALSELADAAGVGVVQNNLSAMPVGHRQVELLIAGSDPHEVKATATGLCAKAFGTSPSAGVVTYLSRGTDDDAYAVLEGLGLSGEIRREPGNEGYDVVYVTLRKTDLQRVSESRIHTALEASLNCEVRIHAR